MSEEQAPQGGENTPPEGTGDNAPPADNTQDPPAPQGDPLSITFDLNSVPEEQRGSVGLFHKEGNLNLAELFKSHHNAQQIIGEKNSLPKTAEGYLEKDMTINVDGEDHPVDKDHPLFKPFLEGAHKAGLPRKKVMEILGEIVPQIVREDKKILAEYEKMRAEVPEADISFVNNRVGELINKGTMTKDDQKNLLDFATTPERVALVKKLVSLTGTTVASGDNRMTQDGENEIKEQLQKHFANGDIDKAKALAQQHNIDWVSPKQISSLSSGGERPTKEWLDPDKDKRMGQSNSTK